MVGNFDPVQFGRLIASVENLEKSHHELSAKIDHLESKMNLSKGIAIGVLLLVGGVGSMAKDALFHMMGK